MTLNSRPFAIIAILMFEEMAFGFVARRGLSISIYYSIARVRVNLRYSFCAKTLLSPSVSSSRHVFSTPQVVKEEIVIFLIFELKRKSTKIYLADENSL